MLAWFGGWPPGVPATVPFAGCLVAAFLGRQRERALPASGAAPSGGLLVRHRDLSLCLGLAFIYRLPALLDPWGWVNRDGAYAAFVALHLRQGMRPAPVFTEGANYQGTLKPHLAALLTWIGIDDLSRAVVLAGILFSLLLVGSSMALARRIGGPAAALVTGLVLALGPRFLTVFSLSAVGQYIEVLALGGLALALTGRALAADRADVTRTMALLAGVLVGAAFWQQPVALAYTAAAGLAFALRGSSWRDGVLPALLGATFVGVLPVVIWNAQNGWASGDIIGREPSELRAQVESLPRLVRRTLTISFPILAGLTPGHPWAESALARGAALILVPATLIAYLGVRGREIATSLRALRPSPALLPPLVMLTSLALFWAIASGKVYWRPRYLLPVVAMTAIHFGVVMAWLWARSRPLTAATVAGVIALNVTGLALTPPDGTTARLFAGAEIAAPYARLVRSLEEKGIRTGYADFSLSAPVTMFTAERIVLSSRLGPTPAYESERHLRKVETEGPDAYVLRTEDDPRAFAAVLDSLGVTYRVDVHPFPVFYDLSRRVRLEEVAGFRTAEQEKETEP